MAKLTMLKSSLKMADSKIKTLKGSADSWRTGKEASNGKGFRLILIHLNNQQQIKRGKPPLLRNT